MFARKERESTGGGLPLNDIAMMLNGTDIAVSVDNDILVARHGSFASRIVVVPPDRAPGEPSELAAVARVTTKLSPEMREFFGEPGIIQMANAFATLGALTLSGDEPQIESRLSIHSADMQAWSKLHLPLLTFALIGAAEGLLGGVSRGSIDDCRRPMASHWSGQDFAQIKDHLEQVSICNADDSGFTAEFSLNEGSVSAAFGHHGTALFRADATEPHPELGGGLFCTLELPHQAESPNQLRQICAQLNRMEMAALDLPPHFGAWTAGRVGNNPAYVSFYPNALHEVSGLGVNAAFWAMARARWASIALPSLGVRI